MNPEKLKQAQALISQLTNLHDLLTDDRELQLTEEERRSVLLTRITATETQLRETGLVAAVQKPVGLRSVKREDLQGLGNGASKRVGQQPS